MPVVIVLLSWLAYCKFTASSFDQHRRSVWWLPTSTDTPTKLGCHHLHSRSQSPFINWLYICSPGVKGWADVQHLRCPTIKCWFMKICSLDNLFCFLLFRPSVLWCWRLGDRKGIWPVRKTEWWRAGVVIGLQQGADLHMAQLMPLPLTVSCFSKIQTGLTFLVPAHTGSPRQRAVKRVCVCVPAVCTCNINSSFCQMSINATSV